MQILPKDHFKSPTRVRKAGEAFIPNPVTPSENIHIGAVIEGIDGSLELCTTAYPSPASTITVRLKRSILEHTSPVEAIIDLEDRQAKFPIGEAHFKNRTATISLFGIPRFEARIVLSRGLHSIPEPSKAIN